MVVNDVGFYNVTGEYITRSGLVEQMIGYYNLKLGQKETRITDFNEGSEIRNLLEAIAVDMYILMQQVNEAGNIAFIHTAEGFWLDKHGANPFINLPRIEGTEASGVVTFSMPEAVETDTTIPGGTVLVSSSTGLDFLTTLDCTISVGSTSANVNCICATRGFDGNVPADDITIILDKTLPNGLTVTNSSDFTGGVDTEDDDDYRKRLLAHIRSDDFGSIGYYTKLLTDIEGVHDVTLVDATGYTKKALINGYSKPVSDTILLRALNYLTDTEKITLGHHFTVDKPTYIDLDLTVNLDVTEEYPEEELENILETFINGGSSDYILEFEGYNIGQSVTPSELVEMLQLLDQVVSVTVLTGDGDPFTGLTIGSGEVVTVGTVSWSQTLVE